MIPKGNNDSYSLAAFCSWIKSHARIRIVLIVFVIILMVKYFFIDKSYPYNINIFDQRIAEYYVWGSNLLNKSDAKPQTAPKNGSITLPTDAALPGISNISINESDYLTKLAPKSTVTTNLASYTPSLFLPQTSSAATTTTITRRNFLGNDKNSTKPLCPIIPPVLVGPIKVWFDYPSWSELSKLYPFVKPGGHGRPENCTSRHKVAIILPYRDRDRHLRAFLHNLHSLLTKQQLDYSIFVVEQIPHQTFNRAKLLNVGFVEAKKLYDWQCFIFHDVDLFPEDDRNLYTCPEQPRHMSVAVDKFGYNILQAMAC
uniref:Beta-1,4-N-acetylgalactosaminyltransferase n=1 Tax=Romanomermis culicivorax TaxID=13658 RepID=A0A915KBU6_ROMCU